MSFKLSPATVKAVAALVVTLDKHRVGAVALVLLVLAAGVSVAIARIPFFA